MLYLDEFINDGEEHKKQLIKVTREEITNGSDLVHSLQVSSLFVVRASTD